MRSLKSRNSDGVGAKQKNMGLVYAALGLFTLIFAFGAFVSLPLDKPVDLGHTGAAGLDGRTGTWYTLKAEEYSIESSLGSVSLHGSFLPFISTRYGYYLVSVTPDAGTPYSMAVRVTGKKYKSLEQGQTVTLYGMASGLTDGQIGEIVPSLEYRCLNDNGGTVFTRGIKGVVFAMAGALCVVLIVRLRFAAHR